MRRSALAIIALLNLIELVRRLGNGRMLCELAVQPLLLDRPRSEIATVCVHTVILCPGSGFRLTIKWAQWGAFLLPVGCVGAPARHFSSPAKNRE